MRRLRYLLRPAAFLLALAGAAQASATDYVYCVVQDASRHQTFYSEIFPGDYGEQQGYRQEYMTWLDGDGVLGLSSDAISVCFYGPTRSDAAADKQQKVDGDVNDGYSVQNTYWTPGA